MIWGIVSLFLLLVVIGLAIWLLIRQGDSIPTLKTLNEPCTGSGECNAGLVCSTGSGTANTVTPVTNLARTCKVAFGGVCSSATDCAAGQTCNNGVCGIALGTKGLPCPCAVGFTCVNNICLTVAGKACNVNGDCATGLCHNNICTLPDCVNNYTGTNCTDSYTNSCTDSCTDSYSNSCTDSYSNSYTDSRSRDSRTDSRNACTDSRTDSYADSCSKSCEDTDSCIDSCADSRIDSHTDSGTDSHGKKSLSRSYSEGQYTDCTDSNTRSGRRHSYDYSHSQSQSHSQSYDQSCDQSYTYTQSYDPSCTDTYSDKHHNKHHNRYIRHGVYTTTENNVDSTVFTTIEQPIIDIAKLGSGFLLLLADGSLVSNTGSTNTMLNTNKKMFRIVRFGTEIIGLDQRGRLYSRGTSTMMNVWTWEHLTNYPEGVEFINSTNTWQNLEVLSCGKAYLYTFTTSWKDGNVTSKRKQKDFRYYGKDLMRYIDIDQRNNRGTTNDGVKYKHIKAAGFYTTNTIVQVLVEDTFTHVRIIDNKAYFLFEQEC